MDGMYQAVTFDFWNTLIYEERGHLRGRRLDAWAGVLEEAGYATERDQLAAVFDKAWEMYVSSWHANEQFQAAQAAEHMLEHLGFRVPPDIRIQLVEAFVSAAQGAELHLCDGVAECITTLKDAGLKLGIICDVGFTPSHLLRAYLDGRGIMARFDHCSFSDEVGAYKPSPVIFRHALDGLGAPAPAEVVHVGDLRRTDVAGARGMGMTSVRYTGLFDDDTADQPEGDHVIADHRLLPGIVLRDQENSAAS
jgi:putative hydrolase of the HAD superfamily